MKLTHLGKKEVRKIIKDYKKRATEVKRQIEDIKKLKDVSRETLDMEITI